MKQVIVITGASSGFGALTARALAQAGHIVYASMRESAGRNASQVAEVARYATEHGVDLRTVELDVASDESAKTGIARIIADKARAAEYDNGPYAGLPDQALKGLASLEPADADAGTVAEAIVRVVGMPFGKRPFRMHIDPSQDGAEIVNGVAERVRAEMFRRIGIADLLSPKVNA